MRYGGILNPVSAGCNDKIILLYRCRQGQISLADYLQKSYAAGQYKNQIN